MLPNPKSESETVGNRWSTRFGTLRSLTIVARRFPASYIAKGFPVDNKSRDYYLRRTYQITLEEYKAMLKQQDYKCAICGKSLTTARVEVDHDHKIEKLHGVRASVRGLLCGGKYWGCNRRLGRVENPKWLRSAADYLEKPPARKTLDKS